MGGGGFRPTRAEIDLAAIRGNCRALRALQPPGSSQLVVVKADAYGHGDVRVARACLEAGADWLGVALVEEGVRLREHGIDAPILVLVEPPAAAAEAVVRAGLVPTVCSLDVLDAVDRAARGAGRSQPVHLAVDTGMHREGVQPREVVEFARAIIARAGCELQGLWTHLAVADEQSRPETLAQLERFASSCRQLEKEGLRPPLVHVSNSPGLLARAGHDLDMVRAGVAVYGLYPAEWLRSVCPLSPAMRLVSRVGSVRRVGRGEGISYGLTYAPDDEANVASVPIGYADGYPRHLSGRGVALVGGKRRPVAGRVTMDQIMLDCGRDRVEAGDEVVLIGAQGSETVTADDLAELSGTINYEIVTRIGPRVPRVYSS